MEQRNLFSSLSVVEVAGTEAGAYVSKLFADHGAHVTRLGVPAYEGQAPIRTLEQLSKSVYLNTNKRLTHSALDSLEELIGRSDIVVESSSPEPLVPITASLAKEDLIRVYLQPLGSTEFDSHYRSNWFTDEAAGGHLFLNGSPSREPLRRPGLHVAYQAAMHAFIGAMAALYARAGGRGGQTVEVSHLEGMATLHQHTVSMWTHSGHTLKRSGNLQPGHWHPIGPYPCADGFVYLCMPSSSTVEVFLHVAGLGYLLDDPRFSNDYARGRNREAFDAMIGPWLCTKTVEELVTLGEELFLPIGPVSDVVELLAMPHLRARDFWIQTNAESTPVKLPRGPFRVSSEVADVPLTRRASNSTSSAGADGISGDVRPSDRSPLHGVRILDMTRVWSGPYGVRLLADLGADVIAVESPTSRGSRRVPAEAGGVTHLYPDDVVGAEPWNRVASTNELMRNRRSLCLDLQSNEGKEIFLELLRRTDVLIENFTPRVLSQLGLTDNVLFEVRPQLIRASLSGFGSTGPLANRPAYGPLIDSQVGMVAMTGYAGGEPMRPGVAWPDPASGLSLAAGVLVALWERHCSPTRTRRVVEVSMLETMAAFLGEELARRQLTNEEFLRRGNRDSVLAPQGVYRCAGGDRWIAISVDSQEAWAALCDVAHLPTGYRGLNQDQRMEKHEAIDTVLGAWTKTQTVDDLERQLQGLGVIARRVADARDLVEDRHLADRSFWVRHGNESSGIQIFPGSAIRLSETPVTYRRPAPRLGEHNEEILHELGSRRPAHRGASSKANHL